MIKIMESRDYGMFELLPFNRDVKNTKKLELSMAKYGWMDAHPMNVEQIGARKFMIKEGHNRYIAAMKLGIPLKFVISNDGASVYEIEAPTKKWSMEDYLVSHCRTERAEYWKVKEYCDETGIGLQAAISMLGGNSAGSGNFIEEFKDGTYVVKADSSHAKIVKEIVLYMKRQGIKFYNTTLLVRAISRLVWLPEFDVQQFKNKVKSFRPFMEKKANLDQYLDMIEDIYNRQSRSKVPLKFLATESSKERMAKILR
jgi:hypothetical protein